MRLRTRLFKLAIRATYPIWHRAVVRCLNQARAKNVIDSRQWHELAAMFDRTQKTHYRMDKTRNESGWA